jgi:threonine/homoserine/homoserine lactone efflux protein
VGASARIGSVLWAFVSIAIVVTVTPGPATALVIRSALRGGRRAALATIAANSLCVLVWAALSVLGMSALVAASATAFAALKVVGAVVLVHLGVQALRRAGRGEEIVVGGRGLPPATAFRDALLTGITNPKLAVFFVALFPQFVPAGAPVLGTALLMAVTIVALDVVWYGTLSAAVIRVRRGVIGRRVAAWLERATGAVLIALGVRVALDAR